MRHLLKTTILLTALLLTMATAAQAATTNPPTVTYVKEGGSYTLPFTSAPAANALKGSTSITAMGTWTSNQVTWLKGALGTGSGTGTNATLQIANLSNAVWSDTESYDLSGLFKDCTALATVYLPAGGVAGSAKFFQAFSGCTSLTTVTNLDKFTNVSSFGNAFDGCSVLQSVTLSPSGSSATEVDFTAAFRDCKKLTSIVNLDKFTNVSGFSNVVTGCPILESVTLSPQGSSVATGVSFGNAFEGCSKLTSVVNLDKFKNVKSFLRTFYNCPVLENVTLPEGSTATDITFERAFYLCPKLTSITNLEKFKNVRSFTSTFEGCTLLPSVTLCPEGSTAAATSFSGAFKNCKALTSIANLDKYTKASNFSETFSGCAALKDITLPVPAAVDISISFEKAFYYCTALERITNLKTYKNVNSISNAFYYCSNLTHAMLGNVPSITTDAFYAVNPNCLKYMPTGTDVSTLPTDWKNVIVGGKATADIALQDKYGSNYCPFYCPEPFDMDGHTMTYTRTWTYATKAGGWNTLCLPFAATAQKKLGSGDYQDITPAATGKDGDYLLKTLAESPNTGEVVLANAATVEAYQPYLVALPGSSFTGGASLQYASVRFASATNATIGKTPDTQQPLTGSQYTMYGTLSDYQADNLYLLYNEKTGSTITGSSFELYADGGGVHPFRAYVKANNANALSAPRLVIKGGGGTTGIREASVGASSTEVPAVSYVYSIDGRLLRTVPASEYGQRLDGLDRGIYIVNGVKEVVR